MFTIYIKIILNVLLLSKFLLHFVDTFLHTLSYLPDFLPVLT